MTTVDPAAPERSPLPPLIVNYPDCPICRKEVNCDADGFQCESCGGTWPFGHDEPGMANSDVPQCTAEVEPHDGAKHPLLAGWRYRCVRDAGHPTDRFLDRHFGVRSDGGIDWTGYPYEWRDGEFPQWTAPEPGGDRD